MESGKQDREARARRVGMHVEEPRPRWEGSGEASVAGQGTRGAVVGWYLPVMVVDEKMLNRAGVRVEVQMRRVAVRETPGGSVPGSGDQGQE